MQIKGQLAIITGGGSGLGEATARHLAALGASIVILDINAAASTAVATAIGGTAYTLDITHAEAAEKVFADIQKQHGNVRICVNCAGIAPGKRVVGREGPMGLGDFQKVIDVNVIGTFNVLRLAAWQMSQASVLNDDGERGIIINTASIAAFEGQIGQVAYSASKGAIVSMALPAAREFARFGVRVNTIAPGIFGTPMLLAMPQEVQDSLGQSVPFPPRLGQPHEYAQLVQHMIENPLINGSVIRLDGALRLQPK